MKLRDLLEAVQSVEYSDEVKKKIHDRLGDKPTIDDFLDFINETTLNKKVERLHLGIYYSNHKDKFGFGKSFATLQSMATDKNSRKVQKHGIQ